MKTVLITGATGNVGLEVIRFLQKQNHRLNIIAGVRDIDKDKMVLGEYNVAVRRFDFTDLRSYKPALGNCDELFLLRPPNIANVQKYFKPLIDTAVELKLKHIVFLSVQGVENSKIIPHYKIEQLIIKSKIPYTFLRPAYFMQNFSTTLNKIWYTGKEYFFRQGRQNLH